MFDTALFDQFYDYNNGENTVVAPEVVHGYFIFLNKFCIHSSYVWKDYLKGLEHGDIGTYKNNLTTSDETLTWWTILTKTDRVKQEADYIKLNGKEQWEATRVKRKSGPHESKEHMDLYTKIFNRISEVRKDDNKYQFWQKKFFNKLFPIMQTPSGAEIDISKQKGKAEGQLTVEEYEV